MILPNFIIAGAAKAGTTTVHDLLKQHPEVGMSIMKEPNFFSTGWPNWATNLEEYSKLFEHCKGKKAIGEASPFYFSDYQSPRIIRETLGDQIKILLSLRNPVKRAFSHWLHEYKKYGRETFSFKDAILQEKKRVNFNQTRKLKFYYPGIFEYVGVSKYFDKVAGFLDVFGNQNLMVLIFEEFIDTPEEHFSKICNFLDIDSSFVPNFLKSNPAGQSSFPPLTKLISSVNQTRLFNNLFRNFPPRLQKCIFAFGNGLFQLPIKRIDKDYLQEKCLDRITYEKLMKEFLPDIKKLEKLLGRNLSLWYEAEYSN